MKERFEIMRLKISIVVMLMLIVVQLIEYIEIKQNVPVSEDEHFVSIVDISNLAEETSEVLPTKEPFVLTNYDKIRVVITNKESGSIYHENVEMWNNNQEYRGVLEIIETEAGYVVVNELPVEEYLYSVVPSEMPSDYPMEALKAQAICARTYAYLHIMNPAYPLWEAHVDDTTAFQVYHSVPEQERTTQAVNETQGMVLLTPQEDGLAETYYYSTSCGYGSDEKVWRSKYAQDYPYIQSKHINSLYIKESAVQTMAGNTFATIEEFGSGEWLREEEEFVKYINSVQETDLEAHESWYRWSYEVETIDTERMLNIMQKRYESNEELILTLVRDTYISRPITELGEIVDIEIVKRGAGGVAEEMNIITEKNVYKVITELNIRYVLNDGMTKVKRLDNSLVSMPTLLPSGFFVLENEYEDGLINGYKINGGGFGHGAGMSQNAAKAMAGEGMNAEGILMFFFEGCIVKSSKERGK